MARYSDAVTLVKKSREKDGTISVQRVNAIVLRSVSMAPLGHDRKPLKVKGETLPPEEHIDLVFPRPGLVAEGATLTTSNLETIFQPAYSVPRWREDAWIGWEPASSPTPVVAADDAVFDVLVELNPHSAVVFPPGTTVDQIAAGLSKLMGIVRVADDHIPMPAPYTPNPTVAAAVTEVIKVPLPAGMVDLLDPTVIEHEQAEGEAENAVAEEKEETSDKPAAEA